MSDMEKTDNPDPEAENKPTENTEPAGDGKVNTSATAEPVEEQAVDAVEDLKQQLDSMSDRYLRLMAEFDNFKKRVSRDYERLVESANEKIMIEMVDVRENFERALRSGENTTDYKSMYDGMKLIFSKFEDVLKKHGLESFAEVDEPFDPMIHDALMKTPHATIPEDHIAEVFEKGYRLKNKVIKHAKVIVSSGLPSETIEK